MRILHVIHDLDPAKGGPAENLLQLADGYRTAGATVEAVTLDPPGAPYLKRYPFAVHGFDNAGSTFGYSLKAAQWLMKNAARFDGLVVDGIWQHLGLAARNAARAARRPYVVFPHGTLDPWFKRTYPLKHIKKQLFWWGMQAAIMRDAYRVVFTTDQERDLARGTFWPSRWHSAVLALGIRRPAGNSAVQCAAFRAHCPGVTGRRLLLFLSRIHPKKGCDLLVEAFCKVAEEHPELDLVMAGPDPEGMRPALEAIAHKAGLAERIHWPGMLQGEAKWGAFRMAEAFVLPSHQENFGLAVAEAIGCGVPVLISSQINIYRSILEDGSGFVEPDTAEGTRLLLTRWLALDPKEREQMQQRATASFDYRFSVDHAAASICSLFAGAPHGTESRA